MTDPTIGAVASKLDELVEEVHQMRVWLVGNGEPGIFGTLRELRRDITTISVRSPSWQRRLAFDVARNILTLALLAVLGWTILGLRVSLGAGP